jgi:hypothetical protein
MSSDQRPGKVRVFSSRTPPPAPARRRGDPQQAPAPGAEPAAQAGDVARPGRPLFLAIPFLLGCAIGGAVIAWLGLGAVS